jgi:hypothetical protein
MPWNAAFFKRLSPFTTKRDWFLVVREVADGCDSVANSLARFYVPGRSVAILWEDRIAGAKYQRQLTPVRQPLAGIEPA